MKNPWLHCYAVLLAACAALLFITGPVVSTKDQRPLYSLVQTHAWLGALVTILMAGLVIWIWRLEEQTWLRRLVWVALGANIIQDLVALESDPIPAPVKLAHALVGELFFSAVVVVAVFTSKNWSQDPKAGEKPVENAPRLRFLTTATALLVLLQVTLGVAYRHRVIEALLHILGALVVAVFLCLAIAAVFRTGHAKLRSGGIALTMAASMQILLGFALLTMESFDDIDPLVVIVATIAHLVLGALTLAAAVVTAILVRELGDPSC
jgi:MFS family permease